MENKWQKKCKKPINENEIHICLKDWDKSLIFLTIEPH